MVYDGARVTSCYNCNDFNHPSRNSVNKVDHVVKMLSIYYQSARGLRSKTIAITETWLDFSIYSHELFPNSFNVFRADWNYVETEM